MSDLWPAGHEQPLGAFIPKVKPYAAKYPLRTGDIERLVGKPVPVTIGVDWYTSFGQPRLKSDGRWWLPRPAEGLGSVRGGHAVCLRPPSLSDIESWWRRYDQGAEGACVGFAASRCMTLLNRAFYDARWLYHEAQKVDPWPGTDYEGTSVDAAMSVLKSRGHKTPAWDDPRLPQGIREYRWTGSVEEIIAVMGAEKWRAVGGLPILNSWGLAGWPHQGWLPFDTLEFLLDTGGEAAVVTDRV